MKTSKPSKKQSRVLGIRILETHLDAQTHSILVDGVPCRVSAKTLNRLLKDNKQPVKEQEKSE